MKPNPPAVEFAVEAKGLRKEFDQIEAVRGIDFAVSKDECFGFLGPNGAGKTTTMRMIGCVSPATGGSFHVFGLDSRVHRNIHGCFSEPAPKQTSKMGSWWAGPDLNRRPSASATNSSFACVRQIS